MAKNVLTFYINSNNFLKENGHIGKFPLYLYFMYSKTFNIIFASNKHTTIIVPCVFTANILESTGEERKV